MLVLCVKKMNNEGGFGAQSRQETRKKQRNKNITHAGLGLVGWMVGSFRPKTKIKIKESFWVLTSRSDGYFIYEISQDLSFDCISWYVYDIISSKLYGVFG